MIYVISSLLDYTFENLAEPFIQVQRPDMLFYLQFFGLMSREQVGTEHVNCSVIVNECLEYEVLLLRGQIKEINTIVINMFSGCLLDAYHIILIQMTINHTVEGCKFIAIHNTKPLQGQPFQHILVELKSQWLVSFTKE